MVVYRDYQQKKQTEEAQATITELVEKSKLVHTGDASREATPVLIAGHNSFDMSVEVVHDNECCYQPRTTAAH